MKKTAVVLLFLGMVGGVSGQEPGFLVRFDGGIGVIPASNGTGTETNGTFPDVIRNVVRGIQPALGPWRIGDLKADIYTTGRIEVKGRGLLLASGNSIGTNANQAVFATLFCEAAAPFVGHSTTFSVPLEPNGDFRIDDTLTTVPATCPSPVLLIRSSAGQGSWFAAGIRKLGND